MPYLYSLKQFQSTVQTISGYIAELPQLSAKAKELYETSYRVLWGPQPGAPIESPPKFAAGKKVQSLSEIFRKGFLGPEWRREENSRRSRYPHPLNETFSRSDPVFPGTTASCEQQLQQPERLVEKYTITIQGHVNERIFLFYQQLLACHKTGQQFDNVPPLHQGESGAPIRSQKGKPLVRRDAAHHSTLPCLVAVREEQKSLYLYGSDYYKAQNATTVMPRFVNIADCGVDDPLRPAALKILNRCAKGEISPRVGLKKFIRIFSRKSEELRRTYEIFEKSGKEILETVEKEPERLSRFAGIGAYASEVEEEIAARAMQATCLAQTNIQNHIDAAKKEVLETLNLPKVPHHYSRVFPLAVTASMKEERDRLAMMRFFSLPASVEETLKRAGKNGHEQSYRLIMQQKKRLAPLAKKIEDELEALRRRRIHDCGEALCKLRLLRNLTPKTVAFRLGLSEKNYELLEKGQMEINREFAEKIGAVLKTDSSLFFPSYFDQELSHRPLRVTSDCPDFSEEGFVIL